MEKALGDGSLGFYDPSTSIFKAPVDGRYEFNFHLAFRATHAWHHHNTDVKIDETVIEHFQSYRSLQEIKPSTNESDSNYYSTQISMKKGQKFSVKWTNVNGNVVAIPNCKANGITVGCSFIQGRLVQRH